MPEPTIESTALTVVPEPEEEEEGEAELDLENPHTLQVMRENSIEIQELVLNNGLVFKVDEVWMRCDGETPAFPLFNKDGKAAVDDKGKPVHVKVGAIFFVEEIVTTVQGEENQVVSTRVPAHYEVWSEPLGMVRRRRIFLDQVSYAEEAVPFDWGADQIITDRMPDALVIDTEEVIEEVAKRSAANGATASQG
jgi:hypothetical protein